MEDCTRLLPDLFLLSLTLHSTQLLHDFLLHVFRHGTLAHRGVTALVQTPYGPLSPFMPQTLPSYPVFSCAIHTCTPALLNPAPSHMLCVCYSWGSVFLYMLFSAFLYRFSLAFPGPPFPPTWPCWCGTVFQHCSSLRCTINGSRPSRGFGVCHC